MTGIIICLLVLIAIFDIRNVSGIPLFSLFGQLAHAAEVRIFLQTSTWLYVFLKEPTRMTCQTPLTVILYDLALPQPKKISIWDLS